MKGRSLRSLSLSLRVDAVEVERLLWDRLRSRRFQNFKFKRQVEIGPYIVDFCCLEPKLIIELDGRQDEKGVKKDPHRTACLEQEGFKVIRFWDHQVLKGTESVLEIVRQALEKTPLPAPPKKRKRFKGNNDE